MNLEHPSLNYSIEVDPVNGQYVKRSKVDGRVTTATESDYLLVDLLIRVSQLESVIESLKSTKNEQHEEKPSRKRSVDDKDKEP